MTDIHGNYTVDDCEVNWNRGHFDRFTIEDDADGVHIVFEKSTANSIVAHRDRDEARELAEELGFQPREFTTRYCLFEVDDDDFEWEEP